MIYRQAYLTDNLEFGTALCLNPLIIDEGVELQ